MMILRNEVKQRIGSPIVTNQIIVTILEVSIHKLTMKTKMKALRSKENQNLIPVIIITVKIEIADKTLR